MKRRRALLESNSPRNNQLRLIETVRVCAERHPFRTDMIPPDDRSLYASENSWKLLVPLAAELGYGSRLP